MIVSLLGYDTVSLGG